MAVLSVSFANRVLSATRHSTVKINITLLFPRGSVNTENVSSRDKSSFYISPITPANRRGPFVSRDPNFDSSISGNRAPSPRSRFASPCRLRSARFPAISGASYWISRKSPASAGRDDPLERSGDAIAAKDSARSRTNPPRARCAHTRSPFASERYVLAVNRRPKGAVKWGADGRGRARARARREERGGSPRDGGSKNARLRAQPLCLFRVE